MSDLFEIVVICSGNRFRSPLVAACLREAARELPVNVGSAGILDLEPMPPLEGALKAASQLGLDLSQHRSRYVGTVPLRDADLVIGFERAHVTTAVVDAGAARERTFTLPELVSLLDDAWPVDTDDPIEHARRRIEQADRLRAPSAGVGLPQVDDPIGTSAQRQHETAREIVDLSGRLAVALFGTVVQPFVRSFPLDERRPWRGLLRRRG